MFGLRVRSRASGCTETACTTERRAIDWGGIVAQHVYAVAVEMRLVNGSPDFDAVSKALKANLGVFAEPLCHVVVQPSAFASKREW